MSVKKSELIQQLAAAYPGFLRRDLDKLFSILINEMKSALKRNERVELRCGFSLKPQIQKARMSRNPRTNEKVFTKEKKTILFKISKEWAKKINEKI